MLFGIGFLKLVCTVALVAVEAFDQWIVEHGHVAGSHPHVRRKNDGRVNARGTGSAVDFTGRKNKATTLGEGYDFIEFGYSHNAPSGLNGLGSLQAHSLPSHADSLVLWFHTKFHDMDSQRSQGWSDMESGDEVRGIDGEAHGNHAVARPYGGGVGVG